MKQRFVRTSKKALASQENRKLAKKAKKAGRESQPGQRKPRRKDWHAGDDSQDGPIFEKIVKRPRTKPATPPGSTPGGPPQTSATPAQPPPEGHPAPPPSQPDTGGRRALVVAVARTMLSVRYTGADGRLAPGAEQRVPSPHELGPLAVGDEVHVDPVRGRVTHTEPRRSRLARPDPSTLHRERVLAANVDHAVVVLVASNPKLGLADRVILAVERGGVAPVLCVNKVDLLAGTAARAELGNTLAPYRDMGLRCPLVSATTGEGIEELGTLLVGATCVLLGHSGVGKSSVLNALDPAAHERTGAVRAGDGKGRHTTTSSSLRELDNGTRVIDTPGVRAFGLWPLERAALLAAFPEIAAHGAGCRYADCSHLVEPDCAVRDAVERGAVSTLRHASWSRLVGTLGER